MCVCVWSSQNSKAKLKAMKSHKRGLVGRGGGGVGKPCRAWQAVMSAVGLVSMHFGCD